LLAAAVCTPSSIIFSRKKRYTPGIFQKKFKIRVVSVLKKLKVQAMHGAKKSEWNEGNGLIVSVYLSLVAAAPLAADSGKSEPAVPVFKDGEAQVVERFNDPDMWIRHDLWVETEFDSDGDGRLDRMHVDVTRQRQTDTEGLKLPVIYITSPYFAGTAKGEHDYFWKPRQQVGEAPPKRKESPLVERKGERPIISKSHVKTWVPRGYVVVHSSSPGTGLSEGCPTIGGKNESLAPKAVVQWLTGKATGYTTLKGKETVKAFWSTGKIGMTGTSFNGTLPLAAATTGVEGLKAIIPIAPNTSYYHYYRSNGLVRHPGGYIGEDIDVLYDFIHSGNPDYRDHCNCAVRDEEMIKGFDRETGDYNDFWAGRDYLNHLGPMKAATLMAHAFNDWNVQPEHSVRIYQALKEKGVPIQAYFHQGGHGGEPPLKQMNRWFTRYLHEIQNDVENEPKSRIVREGDKRDEPTSYYDYPNPAAAPVSFYLSPGAPEKGGLSVEKSSQRGTETLIDNFSFDGTSLAKAEWTKHRLIYTTPILEKPIHLSGTSSITIRLASSKPAANLSVWMVSLPWSKGKNALITDNIITRGWADPQNHRSLRESQPLVPGQFYDVKFDLQPDDQVIPKGQQIALMIFSSDREFTLWPDPGTELTIDLNATSISMPVVGGLGAWNKALINEDKEDEEN
jgi:X-Pro dipeptidyl-peptidase|tara:strand:+ start:1074 stop:3104 length:2031 start_codon:yes stop_codon:yes gene_type:complete